MSLTYFLIFSLATWRVSSLVTQECGPGKIFMYLRKLAGIEPDEDCSPLVIPDTFLAGLFSCAWCASIWVGIGWTVFYLLSDIAVYFALPFAFSALAIFVNRVVR